MRLSYVPVWTSNIPPCTRYHSAQYLSLTHHVNQCYRMPSSELQRAASPLRRFIEALDSGGKVHARVQMRQVLSRRSYIRNQYHFDSSTALSTLTTSNIVSFFQRLFIEARGDLSYKSTRPDLTISIFGGTLLVRSATLRPQLSQIYYVVSHNPTDTIGMAPEVQCVRRFLEGAKNR
jgi:hypothetical protein